MANHNDSYDPYLPSGAANTTDSPFSARSGGTGGPSSSTPFNNHDDKHDAQGNQIRDLQNEISGAVKVMQSNMQEGAARGTRLDTLQDKSDRLHDASVNFTKHSNTLRKKMWAKNMRMKLIIGGGIALIIIIIIIGSVLGSKK